VYQRKVERTQNSRLGRAPLERASTAQVGFPARKGPKKEAEKLRKFIREGSVLWNRLSSRGFLTSSGSSLLSLTLSQFVRVLESSSPLQHSRNFGAVSFVWIRQEMNTEPLQG
jgi:hypothetical protein